MDNELFFGGVGDWLRGGRVEADGEGVHAEVELGKVRPQSLQCCGRSSKTGDTVTGEIEFLQTDDSEQGTQIPDGVEIQIQRAEIRTQRTEFSGQCFEAGRGEFESAEVQECRRWGECGYTVPGQVKVCDVSAGLIVDLREGRASRKSLGAPIQGLKTLMVR